MKTNKIQWKRISEGEALPCDSLLMRYDGTITRGTCAGVKAGQDAYYLPLDELKKLPKEESEDKKMIQYFEDLAPFHEAEELYEKYGFSHKEAIAWIEKQCEHKKFLDSIQVGDKVTRNEDGVLVNLSQLNRGAKKDEKQGGQRTKLVDFDLNAKDSDLQEATYFIPKGFHAEIDGDKVVIKKGKQKPKFRVGDIIKCKYDDRQFIIKSVDLDKGTYTYTQGGCGNDIDYADEEFELVEPKPAEVEPKFKVGDWVIDKQGIVHQIANVIENVTNHTYSYDIVGGGYFNDNTEGVRLWTIQDAKDGDVLVSESTCGINTWYCIFKSLDGDESMTVYCYLARDGRFETKKELCFDKDPYNTKPATKEQRDTLEKAIMEAGYRWNPYEKKMEKIEQKPWSEEDEEIYRRCICSMRASACGFPEEEKFVEKVDNWLKSLKDKIQPQPKQKPWSDDDEYMLNLICENIPYSLGGRIWLKELKNRVGCEANCTTTWKPSKRQMKELEKASNEHWVPDVVNPLYTLLQDLKKLMEE